MRILITGANGQLGNELQSIFSAGASVLGALSADIRNAQIDAVDIPELDIAKQDAVFPYIEHIRPDCIINCAAYTDVDGCESNIDVAFAVNALGPRNLAIAANRVNAKLVHISTDYVFDGTEDMPYKEWDICHPQSIYGYSKYLGEQYVRDFCSQYYIVRTAWLYGHVGKNFVKSILSAAKKNGQLKVVDDQRGNPTNAQELAHHIYEILQTQQYGIYHCSGNGECSWYEFACEIVRQANIQCTVEPCTTAQFPRVAQRPKYSSLDNSMLRCTVGDSMQSWQDALAAFIASCE